MTSVKRTRLLLIVVLALGPFGLPRMLEADDGRAMSVQIGKDIYLGRPLISDDRTIVLLRRDGRITQYDRRDITTVNEDRGPFRAASHQEVQRQLQSALGATFEVSRTDHYVVAHPPGLRATWAEPFEQLYKQFTHYFGLRQWPVAAPEFPLVVIVLEDQQAFYRFAVREQVPNPNTWAGYYSPFTNRVVTYVQSDAASGQWNENRLTLIHEALHQYAFNTGIHSRWAPPPRWTSEGLALMFEARGVHNAIKYPQASQRLHEVYAAQLRALIAAGGLDGRLAGLVESDRDFEQQPAVAYPLAWGLAFMLSETQPAEFHAYLQATSRRAAFSPYDGPTRLADFVRAFGDPAMLESRLERFLAR